MLAAPALSVVPPIYVKHGALGLSAMSVALMLARLFDALIDPIIGLGSDRWRGSPGGRQAWIHAAVLLALVAGWAWFRVTPQSSVVQFLGWAICLCLAWSIFEIVHRAMLADTARDPRSQLRLAAWRTGAAQLGMVVCMMVLQLSGGGARLGPEALQWLTAVTLPLLVVGTLVFHAGFGRHATRLEQARVPRMHWRRVLRSALRDRRMRRLLQIVALQGLATGMTSALYFFYLDTILHIVGWLPVIAIGAGSVGLVAAWAWYPAIARIGNARAILLGSTGIAVILLLFCVVAPGGHAAYAIAGLFMLSALCATGNEIGIVSETARIARDGPAERQDSIAGLFYALENFVTEISVALGAAVALAVVGIGGLSAAGGNGRREIMLLLLGFALLPALLQAAAGWTAWRMHRSQAACS